MDRRLEYVQLRMEEAMRLFGHAQSYHSPLPPEAFQLHRAEEESDWPPVDAVEPFVRFRQTEDMDLDVLYRDLEGR
ncbi:MAG TPA: hypothetical protein VF190_08815 [Rhodothermales bacterium]